MLFFCWILFYYRKFDVFIVDYVGLEYELVNDFYCEFKVVGDFFVMLGVLVVVKKGS